MRRVWAGGLALVFAMAFVPGTAGAALVYINPVAGGAFSGAGVIVEAGENEVFRGKAFGGPPEASNPLGSSHVVRVTNDAGRLTTVPGTDGRVPCEIVKVNEAVCRYDQDYLSAVKFFLGDRNDDLVLGSRGAPTAFFVEADSGNDSVLLALGTIGSFRSCCNPTIRGGPGNDRITIPPPSTDMPGWYYMTVWGDEGDDTIFTANGMIDMVTCGLGNDTWINEPIDQPIYPAEETFCETAGPIGL